MSEFKKVALLALFISYFVKSLLNSNTFVDAAVLMILGGIYAFVEYKASYSQLKQVESTLKIQQEEIKILQEKVNSIKFVQQVRPNTLGMK